MPERELTDAEIEQQDFLENSCYNLVRDLTLHLTEEEIEWDMLWIGEIAELVADIVCNRLKLAKYEDFYPYVDSWED